MGTTTDRLNRLSESLDHVPSPGRRAASVVEDAIPHIVLAVLQPTGTHDMKVHDHYRTQIRAARSFLDAAERQLGCIATQLRVWGKKDPEILSEPHTAKAEAAMVDMANKVNRVMNDLGRW